MKSNQANNCTFVFDTIVTKFESPNVQIKDPKKLQVNLTFNNKTVGLTASRINVTEFKVGSSTEFEEDPAKLRKNLEKCGLPITVTYNGRALGTGQIILPNTITDSIVDQMTDLMISDKCQINEKGEDVGTVEVLCRLIIKCEDKPKTGEDGCLPSMATCINLQDIMFLLSESQRCPSPCDPCLDALQSEEGDERLNLDLKRYESVSVGSPKPIETFTNDPTGHSICRELKKMSLEYGEIIDSVLKCTGQSQPFIGPDQMAKELGSPSPSSVSHCQENPKVTTEEFNFETVTQTNPIRFCPVCLNNMSWMPKFAACPNCNVKPMPAINIQKEQTPTAEEVLIEYMGKPPQTIEDYCKSFSTKPAEENFSKVCRCTCKFGKLCAHCRVREMCANFFKSENNVESVPETEASEVDPAGDICVSLVKSEMSRPFLARVFSELRDLHSIDNTKRASELERECNEQSSRKKSRHILSLSRKNQKKRAPIAERRELTRRCINIQKSKKPKRKLPNTGHKACTAGPGLVSRRHGWNWASSQEARKFGWRPGTVSRPIKRLMKFFLHNSEEHNVCKEVEEKDIKKERDLPMLNMCKKNGEIFITLRAINNNNARMEPIMFKVVKSELAKILSEIKKNLKDKGFRKCTCHRTLLLCTCRTFMEREKLKNALEEECHSRGIEACVNDLVLTDTSESDVDFDFNVTPPAGVAKPPLPKPSSVARSTQTAKPDLKVQPKYPKPQSFYWRAYNCAAGDRYTSTAFGAPGEVVFEDGAFNTKGGGPHGVSACPGGRPKHAAIWGEKPGGPMRGPIRQQGHLAKMPFGHSKDKSGNGNKPIPVRMPKRLLKPALEAAEAEKNAERLKAEMKKKGPDMMKYMMDHGEIAKPWNPNNPEASKGPKTKPSAMIGADGLTSAQRKRIALLQVPMPPIDTITRLGKGYDADCCYSHAARCYNPCGAQCYDSCAYYC
ncbi:uncharacterized protein [Drosophila virilis]|uniref:DUF4776 domain-containing protein n=1 Tax=Drosophila virilis TaxID=7244 RepID=A0A0Q9WH61_DROVI|nr:uncharacterized protein LOC26531835 [Drosophila virilis]KRF83770.1 uncharacterized protein Dvir_GJ27065 [Drosophila virilis]